MKFTYKSLASLAVLASVLIACEKEDPEATNENEVFSNVNVHLENENTGVEYELRWHDENGDGEITSDEIETEALPVGSYHASITFAEEEEHEEDEDHEHEEGEEHEEDETALPTSVNRIFSDDHDHEEGALDQEIENEGDVHFFFFETPTGFDITYLESDLENFGGTYLGKEFEVEITSEFNGGDFRIVLLHEPESQDITATSLDDLGGSVDVDVTFSLETTQE